MGESNLIEKIGRIADNIAESYSVAQEKGAIMPETQNSDNLPDTLRSITSGGAAVSVPMKDVNFYDYDGTRLYSYTVSEAAALTELPPLPTQPGLICRGWNWTLDNIKAMGRAVDVGAMYITDDGKTRIYITLQEGRTSPMLGCCPNGTVTVDWGDGTTPTTLNGQSVSTLKWTSMHRYATAGDYVITLTVDGTMGFGASEAVGSAILVHTDDAFNYAEQNYVYLNCVRRIEVGDGVTSIGDSAFNECGLESITLPDGVTSIGDYAFSYCSGLKSITLPDGVTSIGDSAFSGCSLESITLPYGVTSIGNYTFYFCFSLKSITLPDGVTSIGDYAFNYCYCLASITLPDGVTSIGEEAFSYCSGLESITLPDGVTSIGDYAFSYCGLASITLPDSVTSIGEGVFFYCCYLASITLPDSVTSIGKKAFYYCFGVSYYDFTRHATVPELSGADAFGGILDDCEIRVPAALEGIWKAATNWAEYADYIVGV